MVKCTKAFTFLSLLFFVVINSSKAQVGEWTWIHGSQTNGYVGNYGTKGVAAATNEPPARYQAATLTDNNGDFWMFGGANGGFVMNDLWKYEVSTNEWTWVHGPQASTNVAGSYGTMGVTAPTNLPPARGYGAIHWVDSVGDFYIYGGATNGAATILADLWKYSVSLDEWVWIAGSNTANVNPTYGVLGVGSPANTPGSRYECNSSWVFDGKLWFFGGAYGSTEYNDVWAFDLTNNVWIWMGGNAPASFGTLGVAAASNVPTEKFNYCRWKDADDNVYFFGGSTSAGSNNEMWKYDPNTLLWTWIGGTQTLRDVGQNSGYCNPNVNDIPPSRFENNTAQYDIGCGSAFWTFGGIWRPDASSSLLQYYNDLWVYNNTTAEWTLVWGDPNATTSPGFSYGTKGMSSPTNAISPRGGACMWTDKDGSLYVFGGYAYDAAVAPIFSVYKADMWRYVPDTACYKIKSNIPAINFPDSVTICTGDSVVLNIPTGYTANTSPTTDFYFDAATNKLYLFPTSAAAINVEVSSLPGTPCPFQKITTVYISTNPLPKAGFNLLVDDNGATNINSKNTSSNADNYEWFFENNLYATDKDISMTVTENKEYCFVLKAVNSCGSDTLQKCVAASPVKIFIPTAFTPNGDTKNDFFKIISNEPIDLNYMRIFNRWGQQIFESNDSDIGWDGDFGGEPCPIGTYFYTIEIQFGDENKKYRGDISLLR